MKQQYNHQSQPYVAPYHSLNISTVNCRGLRKTSNLSVRNSFIRYLRSRSFDLLALQETHAHTTEIQNLFHTQFQATSSLWSAHCGLVCLSSNYVLSNSLISTCSRIIFVIRYRLK
ncbi:unnamed protein product [Rhizopus stolonifer]